MDSIRNLTEKTIQTLRRDGLRRVGQKAQLYLSRKRKERAGECYADQCFREVLFVNGCDEHLPHPGRYRVTHQREQLESLGVSTGEVYYQNLQLDTLRCYRVFIFFRCPCTELIETFVERARALHKTVLYDVDDLVFDTLYTDMIPYLDTMTREERTQYDENVRSMGKLLRLCDGAVTSTSCLAEELEQHVSRVLINRNVASEEMVKLSQEALDRKQQAKTLQEQNVQTGKTEMMSEEKTSEAEEPVVTAPVRIGYFSGSITHNDDFQMILPVLLELLEQYERLELHLAGELELPEKLYPYRDRIRQHPFSDWRGLPEMIASVDINLAPLTNTTFNRAKSENKWMEAALVKVPTVASDIGAFHAMVENGTTGILCQNEQQWAEALRALIEQPQYRQLIGEAAFAYCMEHCVTANTGVELMRFLKEQENRQISFLLPGFQVSGGVMVALQHAGILQDAGWDVLLLSIEERGAERWYEFEGHIFPVLNVNDSRILGAMDGCVATMWSTCDWLEQLPAVGRNYYLVQNYEPDFYAPGDPLRILARKTYGFHPDWQYLTISRWCQDWLKEQYGHEAAYAPNGLDVKKFAAELPERDGMEHTAETSDNATDRMEETEASGSTSGSFGRKIFETDSGESGAIAENKKIRILVEGDSSAPHKNVDESFQILQRLDREKYEIWYLAYHGTPKDWYPVDKFLPQVPYGEVQQVYAQCDILLKSSILESFSYPPLEMMASGGYVVAVLNGGNREYLQDGVNCLTYPQGDLTAAAAAIERIAGEEELRRQLYENGLATAKSRDWEQIREDVRRLYEG